MDKPVPKYYKIYEELLKQIQEGKYDKNNLFPSDTELVKKYRVSRGTVREAIKLLFQEGYLVREQGKGTYVTYTKIHQDPETLIGFTELMRKHDIEPSARMIKKDIVTPPSEISHLMHIDGDKKAVRVIRLRFGNGQPLIIERSYFLYSLFEPIYDMDLESNSIYELLYDYTDTRLSDATQQIEAISAGPTEKKLLEVELKTPLLLIKRLIKTEKGEIFQYSEDVYRSDRINFTTRTSPYDHKSNPHALPLNLSEQQVF